MRVFAAFCLDVENQCLWRDGERVALTPKAFGVLTYLVDRAGELVPQNELLDALWAEKFVQPDVLKTHILEIRSVLGDDAKNPKFIETQPRRGYRFVAPVSATNSDAAEGVPVLAPPDPPPIKKIPKKHTWLIATAAGGLVISGISAFLLRSREQPQPVPLGAFQIPMPETATNTQFGTRLATSPDGKHFVFRAQAADGSLPLWLRDLDSLEVRELPGTDTKDPRIQPAWSPDSRFIAFHSDGQIKKIEIAGGPVQVVCDVPGGVAAGIAWTGGGQLVFGTTTDRGGILRVSANGGTPQVVTQLDPSRGEYRHWFPSALPDGKHFLYTRASHTPGKTGTYIGSVDAAPDQQSPRPLPDLPGMDSSAVYASGSNGSGFILYRDDGTIMARPFDERRLEFTGSWHRVAEMASLEDVQPGFSLSENGVLVYQSKGTFGKSSRLTWFDRQGKAVGTVSSTREYQAVSVAPDGKRIAIKERLDLWLIDPSETTTTRLTFHASGEDVSRASWSPDGTRLAFGSTYGHRDYMEVYEKVLTERGPARRLVESTAPEMPKGWSPDGRYLLYERRRPDAHDDIWALPISSASGAGGQPFLVLHTPFSQTNAVFSPDSKWIAYTSDESGKSEVYVRPFVSGAAGETAPGGGRLISNNGGIEVRWPRDGQEIFYLSPDGDLMAVPVTTRPEFHAGVPRPAVEAKAKRYLWDVSADGKKLLIAVPVPASPPLFTVLMNWQAELER